MHAVLVIRSQIRGWNWRCEKTQQQLVRLCSRNLDFQVGKPLVEAADRLLQTFKEQTVTKLAAVVQYYLLADHALQIVDNVLMVLPAGIINGIAISCVS
jgi:hypothetical protein